MSSPRSSVSRGACTAWVFAVLLALSTREVGRPSRLLILGLIVLLSSLPQLLLEVDQRMPMLMLPSFVVGAVLLFHGGL